MKRLDGSLQGSDAIRKSLQALLGADVPIKMLGYTPESYQALLQMNNNTLEGRPIDDDVTGGLDDLL